MKKASKRLIMIIAIVVTLGGIGIYMLTMQSAETGINVPIDQEGQGDKTYPEYPIRVEYQLFPPEEQTFDADFDSAYKEFVKAVRNKDLSALEGFLYDKIQTSPYDEDTKGLDEFYDYWDIESVLLKETEIWSVLEEIIELGGRYDAQTKSFVAPYTYFDCPEEYKDESDYCFIIVDKNVKLYAERKTSSNVITELDYNIVYLDKGEREFWKKVDNDLIKIITPSGMKGYIQKKYIRSLIDFRFEIRYINNEWKLIYLIYGE